MQTDHSFHDKELLEASFKGAAAGQSSRPLSTNLNALVPGQEFSQYCKSGVGVMLLPREAPLSYTAVQCENSSVNIGPQSHQ